MTPTTEDLRDEFDAALEAYIQVMRERKRALEKAMETRATEDHAYYTAQSQRESQLREHYYALANQLRQRLDETPRR